MSNEMSAGGQGEATAAAPDEVVVSTTNTVRVVGFAPRPLDGVGAGGECDDTSGKSPVAVSRSASESLLSTSLVLQRRSSTRLHPLTGRLTLHTSASSGSLLPTLLSHPYPPDRPPISILSPPPSHPRPHLPHAFSPVAFASPSRCTPPSSPHTHAYANHASPELHSHSPPLDGPLDHHHLRPVVDHLSPPHTPSAITRTASSSALPIPQAGRREEGADAAEEEFWINQSPSASVSSSVSSVSTVSHFTPSRSPLSPYYLRPRSPAAPSDVRTSCASDGGADDRATRRKPNHTCQKPPYSPRHHQHQLVGSFEESVFSGRLVHSRLGQRVEGFQAVLATAAGAGGRGKRRLQFAAQYLPAAREGRAPPYFATIALDAPAPPPPTQHHQHHQHHSSASASSCCATHATTSAAVASSSPAPPHTPEAALHAPAGVAKAAAARYRVPREGQLLLVLSNPEGTPIHTFCAKYDLRHLSPNSKTMLRQRVTAAPKPPPPTDGPVECDAPQLPRSQVRKESALRYAMNLRFACMPPRRKEAARAAAEGPGAAAAECRLYLYEGVDVIFTPQLPDTQAEELHTHTLVAEPGSSPAKGGGA